MGMAAMLRAAMGPGRACGQRERLDGDVRRRTMDRVEDGGLARGLERPAWQTNSAAAAVGGAAAPVFPHCLQRRETEGWWSK